VQAINTASPSNSFDGVLTLAESGMSYITPTSVSGAFVADNSYEIRLNSIGKVGPIGPTGETGETGLGYDVVVSAKYSNVATAKIQASDSDNAEFGKSVAISADGTTAIVGKPYDSTSPTVYNGSAYIFIKSGDTWVEQAKIEASDKNTYDLFGTSVSISANGNKVLIGAEYKNGSYQQQGAAYVFVRSGTSWSQEAKLEAIYDAQNYDQFGYSVALSANGNTALIGAPNEDSSGTSNNGAAYVFTATGSSWSQQDKLLASDKDSGDLFGKSVALSSDGSTALIGAAWEFTSPNYYNGAAYVFVRTGGLYGSWSQEAKLLSSDRDNSDQFGESVALSADGNTALIGAYGDSSYPTKYNHGSAYIFTRSFGAWTQEIKLIPSDLSNEDAFGRSVSLSSDGTKALVSAINSQLGSLSDAGSTYVFVKPPLGFWTQQQKLFPPKAINNGDGFGRSVSISGDGNTGIIGVPQAEVAGVEGSDAGTAYIFDFTASPALNWASGVSVGAYVDQSYVKAIDTDNASNYTVGTLNLNSPGLQYVTTDTQAGTFVLGNTYSVRLSVSGTPGATGIPGTRGLGYDVEINPLAYYIMFDGVGYPSYIPVVNPGAYTAGSRVRLSAFGGPGGYAEGTVTSVNETTIYYTVEVLNDFGYGSLEGPFTVSIAGNPGAQGSQGDGYSVSLAANYNYAQVQKLLASDKASDDYLGSLISISADGNTAIIGAASESTSPNFYQGAAYIFTRSGITWTQQAKLLANDAANSDYFGISVSISADGNTAIIGAYNEGTSPNSQQGAAYVFTRSGSTWTQQAKLLAGDAVSVDAFGYSVSLSSDGNTALIGAIYEDTSAATSNGAAYVFTRSGSTWTQQAKLLASDFGNNDQFGTSVYLSSDGNTALIGAATETTSFSSQGAAYVFTRSGSTWTQQAKLLAGDAGSNDYLGLAVSLSADGNTALLGARNESTSPTTENGAAYVFTRSGSTWTQQAKLLAGDKASYDYFGNSVSLSSNGNIAIIGAYLEATSPNSSNGAAYVFTRSGSTWTQQQKIGANDAANSDYFGRSVALSADGSVAMISADGEDTSPTSQQGAVYVFNTLLNWQPSVPLGAYTNNAYVRATNSPSNYIDGTLTIPGSGSFNYIIPSIVNGTFTIGSQPTITLSVIGQPGSFNAAYSFNQQVSSYTLVLADSGKIIELSNASANNLTVPLDSSVAFPVGTNITVIQTGAGQTTINPTGGVTINGTPGLKLRTQWSSATLIKRAANTWVAIGDLVV
jgi:hypothetical protein